MKVSLIHQLGNWNAQLFRESIGRLNVRKVATTTLLSLVGQLLIIIHFYLQLPGQTNYSIYCLKSSSLGCIPDAVNWQNWWLDVFRFCNWFGPLILILGGVYKLISDLSQEEKRGTLNFIRLSPQSSQSILIGKILGVPILIYLAILLGLPLHLWAAQSGGLNLAPILAYYVLLAVISIFFYCSALVYTLSGGFQAWLGTLLIASLLLPTLQVLNFFSFFFHSLQVNSKYLENTGLNEFRWFYLPIASNFVISYSFVLFTVALATYGMWRIVNRRFQNPNATVLSKQQSYIFMTTWNLWTLGFALPNLQNKDSNSHLMVGFSVLFFIAPFCFLMLIAALSPQRQTLQDWARYQAKNPKRAGGRVEFLRDLVFGEKSPALLAIAIDLLIPLAIWLPWIVILWPQKTTVDLTYPQPNLMYVLGGLALTTNLWSICAAIAQIILLIKVRKPQIWAAGALGAILVLPLLINCILRIAPEKGTELWLLSAFPMFAIQYAPVTSIFLILVAQWGTIAFLVLQLSKQLRKLGESELKALLAGRTST